MREFLFLVLLIPVCVSAQIPPKFTIKDLGSLPGKPNCSALAVSQSGLVTGWCSLYAGSYSGFLYSNGVMKDLGAPPMPAAVIPTAVNDAGVVVGSYVEGDMVSGVVFASAFLYQNGAMQQMPNIYTPFVPLGLTNSGQVAGTELNSLSELFFTYFYGQAILIPTLGGQPAILPSL
jgi:probable HAF family extracellular repeat protein